MDARRPPARPAPGLAATRAPARPALARIAGAAFTIAAFAVAGLAGGCPADPSAPTRAAVPVLPDAGQAPVPETPAPETPAPETPAPETPASDGAEGVPGDAFVDALTGHLDQQYVADLEEIKRRGVLRVITRNNSTSYFLYRGVEAGFNYELAKLFADELGVRLEMVVPKATRDMIPSLLEGKGDIIIGALAADAPRVTRVKLTRPYLHTSLVVITRENRVPRIESIDDLGTATLLVRPSSSATKRLRALARETKLGFHIKAARETLETEDIIDLVASGEVDCAVVDRRIADVELMHRSDVRIALELPTEPIVAGFAVHPDSEHLWRAADDFLRRHYRGTLFNILYRRYHTNPRRAAAVRDDELRADKSGRLTRWDEVFQEAADTAGVDWRLLVSQAYQESRLDPKVVSPFGAQGLMQIMPATAKELGVLDPFDPEQSIRGGAKYIGKLMDRYTDEKIALKDRVRFALAGYNVGPGHLDDARKLAEKEGLDPNRWFGNVERALLLLSKPRYFREATYGYCRGEEPVRYVSEIQTRYDAYVRLSEK